MGKIYTKIPTFRKFCILEGLDTEGMINDNDEELENEEGSEEVVEGKTSRYDKDKFRSGKHSRYGKGFKETRKDSPMSFRDDEGAAQDDEEYEDFLTKKAESRKKNR